jgi:2-(acetamidomethylene)succinate hydrolase
MSGDTLGDAGGDTGGVATGPAGLRHVRAGGVELCVRDRGSGRAVVLLHGTTATLGVWDAVVDGLGGLPNGGVRTIAVDQRGHGRSGKPATGYGAAEYVSDLAALIETLGCAPAVVAGHSLGARNAVVLGAARPDLVAGVVAVDYTPFVEPEVLDRLDTRVRGGDRSFASLTQIEEYLRARYPRMPSDAVRRRVRYGYVPGDGGHRPLADPSAMVLTVAGLRHDFAAETKAITVPVTLMRGEDSAIVSRAAYSATRALRPDLRAVEVSGADHYVPEENPAAVAAEIAHMLARTR